MTAVNTKVSNSRKPVTKKIKSKSKSLNTVAPIYRDINPQDIVISETRQQKSRRKHIQKGSLEELTASIELHGIIEPLIVRATPNSDKFDLIAGERRLRAALAAKLNFVPCMVRTQTDDEILLDIQTHENLHREELHPLAEALGYADQIKQFGLSIEQLAAKIGKSAFYIHSRLQLDKLIKRAKDDFQKDLLPLKHAELIAKYSAAQQELILEECTYRGYNNDPQDGTVSFRELAADINRHIHTRLSEAPFSIEAENLRADKLACTNCPERTGYLPTLFGTEKAEDDKCLNRPCFTAKTNTHIANQAEKIAQASKLSKTADVPLLGSHYYGTEDDFPQALNTHAFVEIKKKKASCENTETGVFVGGRRIGETQDICRQPNCEKHFFQTPPSSKSPADKRIERMKRKEELFDYRAGQAVHRRVLTDAMSKFKVFEISQEKWLDDLVAYLWQLQTSNCRNTISLIIEIIADWTDFSEPANNYYFAETLKMVENLTPDHKYELLFLLQNTHKGAMFGETYQSQTEITAIAGEFEVDYRLLDAEERYNLTQENKQYKKHAATFKEYLEKVRTKKKAKLPRVFSTEYKGEKLF